MGVDKRHSGGCDTKRKEFRVEPTLEPFEDARIATAPGPPAPKSAADVEDAIEEALRVRAAAQAHVEDAIEEALRAGAATRASTCSPPGSVRV